MVLLSVPVRLRPFRALWCSALCASLLLPTARVHAQRPAGGSVRVSTDDWANEYVRLLRQRGFLNELNPLVQPYRATDIARAVARLDPDTLPRPVRDWVRLLRDQFGWRSDSSRVRPARFGGQLAAGARASTSRRLDPLRPSGSSGTWPWVRAGAWLETGPLSAETRLRGDRYFKSDPDGTDPGQTRGAQTDFAYLAADFPVASIELGRFARNWAISDQHGLMVSSLSTPYPQLGFEARAWRMVVRSFTGELDTLGGRKRFLAAHRLDYESPNLVLSFGESSLYSLALGGFSLRYLNPMEFLFFDQGNAPDDAQSNLMLDGQLWWHLKPLVVTGEFMLDDIDIAPQTNPAEPIVYAAFVGVAVPALTPWFGVRLTFQQVSAWAYRAYTDQDRYSYLQRGLGENFSDYDRLELSADLFVPIRGLWLTPLLQRQRQGEGNLRDSIPGGVYAGKPTNLLGVVESTYRVGLRGRYQPTRFAWLAWDLGYNWIQNRNHVQGAAENLFSAAAQLGVRIDFPLRRGS